MDRILTLLTSFVPTDLTPGYTREFHAAVRAAIADGKLTEEEIADLERRKEELGLSHEVLDAIRQDLYVEAFSAATEDEHITEDEWAELEHIQDYLDLKDADIAGTKRELYRMRILSEIKKGNLPIVQHDGFRPGDDELVHWAEQVQAFRTRGKGKVVQDSATFDLAGWTEEDEGILVITSKRVVLTASKTDAWTYRRILGVRAYTNGVLLSVNKEPSLFLRYTQKGNHNIVGSVLLALLEHSSSIKELSDSKKT